MTKHRYYKKFGKRFFDCFLSVTIGFILIPLILTIILLVRFRLGSPVIFKQKRPGKNGKIFLMYKFRTMTEEKDDAGKLLPDDQRLTGFGKFLRSTSLDELPELWNIIKGDMSLVGPRPLLPEYLSLYNENQNKRHDVRPGLTGLAQVNGRNVISWEEKFEYDIQYVENISLKLDLLIILKTAINVFLRKDITDLNNVSSAKFVGNKEE